MPKKKPSPNPIDNSNDKPISGVVDLRPKRAPIDWEEAARLYVEENLSFSAIARRFGYSSNYVRDRLVGPGPVDDGTRWDGAAIALSRAWSRVRQIRDRAGPAAKVEGSAGSDGVSSWPDFRSFRAWSLESGYAPDSVFVRIDPSAGYSPANCRFVSKNEAAEMRKKFAKSRRWISAFGEAKGIMAWARDPRCCVSEDILRRRLDAGIDPEKAISEPPTRLKTPRRTASHSKRTAIDWDVARDLYERVGRTPTEIARKLGTSKSTINWGLRKLGVAPRMRPGITNTPDGRLLHKVWSSMRARCERPEDRSYSRVGARGIIVCDEWSEFQNFMVWAQCAGWSRGLRLVRVDPRGPYSPSNCRFVAPSEVARIRPIKSRLNDPKVLGTAFGETKGLREWSRDSRCLVSLPGLLHRVRGGMRFEEALTKPPTNPGGSGRESFFIEAFGETKSLADWQRDPRCRVTANALRYRLREGMNPETAISMLPFRRPLKTRLDVCGD